jgi:hypothetical protein
LQVRNENNTITVRGAGFPTLLTLLFIGLKLAEVIDWNWFWILLPMLWPFAVVAAIFGSLAIAAFLGAIFAVICGIADWVAMKNRARRWNKHNNAIKDRFTRR